VAQPLRPKVTRWPADRPAPDERKLRALLSGENVAPYAWGNPPGDRYAAHHHPYHKILYCLTGSIVFELPSLGEAVELRPGDRLDLPPHVEHAALVGPEGVVCLEAHRPR
jgi:quercetin dioxygenase-like cupin family protein